MIMGSVTNFMPIQMSSVAMFNMHLDKSEMTEHQAKNRREHSRVLLLLEKGISNSLGEDVQKMNCKDWRERLIDHLPYKKRQDSLLINIPTKFNPYGQTKLTQEEINRKFDDSENNIFVFADYLKPGRH